MELPPAMWQARMKDPEGVYWTAHFEGGSYAEALAYFIAKVPKEWPQHLSVTRVKGD